MFRTFALGLQAFLNKIGILSILEKLWLRSVETDDGPPPIFILGCPRTGTTLIYEILCGHYKLGYFSNIAMLFYTAPALTTALASKLFKRPNPKLQSDFGFVSGVLAPSEAGPFWKYNLPELSADEMPEARDAIELGKCLAAISNSMGGPMLVKNLYLQSRLAALKEAFPNMTIVRVLRDPAFTAQSIYHARKKVMQDEKVWWGPIPNGYQIDSNDSPLKQIVDQVVWLEKELEEAMNALVPEAHILTLNYEDFCRDPNTELGRISNWYKSTTGWEIEKIPNSSVPSQLAESRRQSLNMEQWQELQNALKEAQSAL